MLRLFLYKLRLVRYAIGANGWVVRLQYWWLSQEREHLIFASILGLIPAGLIVAIWFSVNSQHVLIEGRQDAVVVRQHGRELRCLARNVYHEARGEPEAGQIAVAEVTMNRVASKHYPDTVCDVVYEQRWDRIRKRYVGAFSWTELESVSAVDREAWDRAQEVAEKVYYKKEAPKVDGALFYHARRIRPSWARRKVRVARIGRHIFYR